MLFFKFVLASYIPNTPTIVKRGLEWQKRVVDERVYGRLVDSDKERKIKQLFFKPTPNRPEIAINSAEDINDRDEE